MKALKKLALGVALGAIVSGAASADDARYYEVTITNVTHEQLFTPILVATHSAAVRMYSLGQPASAELSMIAEGGNIQPMTDMLKMKASVSLTNTGGPVLPGKTVKVRVRAKDGAMFLSLAGMLVPTNDGFVALNSVPLPMSGSARFTAVGHDAGSEPNDELCAHIPGPQCGGEGASPMAGGEGYVHVHRGIHGIGNLAADHYDWRNPVAEVSVRRVSN